MYNDVIEELIEVMKEDIKDNVNEYILKMDINRILDRFVTENTWQLKARITDLEDELYKERRK